MNSYLLHELFKQQICLLPQKGVFWPAKGMLIIADVHLGKVMHFRKAGIPVPTDLVKKDLNVIWSLIHEWQPKRVVFLGDLFHSSLNTEWLLFGELMEHFSQCKFELILGNHDTVTQQHLAKDLLVYEEHLTIDNFIFTHIPLEEHEVPNGYYNLSGHLHPAVKLVGKGKQSMQFPCFFFGSKQGLLPAFGSFTGYVPVKIRRQDHVFPIIEGRVVKV